MIPLWLRIAGPIAALGLVGWGISAFLGSVRSDERGKVTSEFTIAEQKADILELQRTLAEERKRSTITEQKNEDLARDMAADRAGLAAYVDRLRKSIAVGGLQGPGAGQAAGAAGEPGAAGGVPLLDDLRICTDNTRRLLNAKAWYEDQRALKPADIKAAQ
ncbi:hypothetical protein O4H52_07830 [Sphingomonadaceae bacterium G21617-S1]|nr:hypothetical protein [Sphingomonadaceae bacterium G21617-S1]